MCKIRDLRRARPLTPGTAELGDPLEDLTASRPTSANTTDPADIEGLWDKLRSEIDSERGQLRAALEAAVRREALAKEAVVVARNKEAVARDLMEVSRKGEEVAKKREEEAELELGRERSEREKESGRWLEKEALWVAEKGRLNERIRELEEQIAA
ncbi:MAG: hypothetical protein M1839_004314 [Geoglossum umbratile]|nr:MAG: hypothetical protein M1839_004314 [Geoglossum umbratile]